MRTRLAISAVLVTSVVLASFAIGGGSASGQTSIHVLVHGATTRVGFLNVNGPRLRLGDRVSARSPLVDPATDVHVGSAYGDCWVARQIVGPEQGFYNCTYLLKLAGGTLILQGLDPHGDGSSPFAVTGGSGAYKDAHGDAVFTDSQGDTDMEISLSD
jgi:hypothetical protein